MDPKFEKHLNETVKGSYQIKTTSQDILSKRAMKQPQKTPFYKRGFYLMTIALSATVIALAIYIPLSLRSTPTTSLNSLDPISSIGEIEVSPLKDDASSLAYEVRSLYPLIKKETSTESLHPSFQYWSDLTQDVFSDVINSYEEIQAPIHEEAAAFEEEKANEKPCKRPSECPKRTGRGLKEEFTEKGQLECSIEEKG